MTPLQLLVIIAASGCYNADFYNETDTYREQTQHLVDEGMIELNNRAPIGHGYKFIITPKGKFWLEYILSLPYPVPVQEWRMP